MPDLTRIIDALVALVRATPSSYITISKHKRDGYSVCLSHCSDADARSTASALDVELAVTGNSDEEWLRGECYVGNGVHVLVYGAHHRRAARIDEDAITAALAQAEAAVKEHA